MKSGLIIFGAFTLVVAFFLIKYEAPKKRREKITGRGGDFEG